MSPGKLNITRNGTKLKNFRKVNVWIVKKGNSWSGIFIRGPKSWTILTPRTNRETIFDTFWVFFWNVQKFVMVKVKHSTVAYCDMRTLSLSQVNWPAVSWVNVRFHIRWDNAEWSQKRLFQRKLNLFPLKVLVLHLQYIYVTLVACLFFFLHYKHSYNHSFITFAEANLHIFTAASSVGWTSMRWGAEIRTQACLTASQRIRTILRGWIE